MPRTKRLAHAFYLHMYCVSDDGLLCVQSCVGYVPGWVMPGGRGDRSWSGEFGFGGGRYQNLARVMCMDAPCFDTRVLMRWRCGLPGSRVRKHLGFWELYVCRYIYSTGLDLLNLVTVLYLTISHNRLRRAVSCILPIICANARRFWFLRFRVCARGGRGAVALAACCLARCGVRGGRCGPPAAPRTG